MRVWRTIANLVKSYGRCAMVTVVEVRGSAPREEGARLFVVEGGGYRGTIGGGALEWRALIEAQDALRRRAGPKIVSMVLGPHLGQCCGGQVKLMIEVLEDDDLPMIRELAAREKSGRFATVTVLAGGKVERRPDTGPVSSAGVRFLASDTLIEQFGEEPRTIYLFGAGHVGRALVLALAPLPFAVTWIDSRSEAFPAAVPANVSIDQRPDPAAAVPLAPAGTFVLVMTHSHAMDLAIVARALTMSRIPYVGVIGSDTKRARFLSRLRAAGARESEVARFVCPIGLPGIRSKVPAIIAASTAADLLARDELLALASVPVTLVHKTA